MLVLFIFLAISGKKVIFLILTYFFVLEYIFFVLEFLNILILLIYFKKANKITLFSNNNILC